jgi:hypothetical protein
MVVDETVCEGVTVHVDPDPERMVVPAVTPVPDRRPPTPSVPEVVALTVRVVPEIAAVTTAGARTPVWVKVATFVQVFAATAVALPNGVSRTGRMEMLE